MSRPIPPGSLGADPVDSDSCAHWEAALVDLLDGTLGAEDEAAFRRHAARCAACETLLRESTLGRDWARLLHDAPPEVPEALLGRILEQTGSWHFGSGAPAPSGDVVALPVVLPSVAWSLRSHHRARLVMTAAMAFFSIAITFSMLGFRIADLRATVQAPAAMEANASRHFYEAKKQVVSFYDNLRVVRELEATMENMRGQNQQSGKQREPKPEPSARRAAQPFAPTLVGAPFHSHHAFLNQADERNIL